jgi:transposase
MEVVHARCCGLDVHKETVVACLLAPGADAQTKPDVRTFGTLTDDLLALGNWLAEAGCTHVAMESTGVYWKPIVRHEALLNREGMKGPPQQVVAAAC